MPSLLRRLRDIFTDQRGRGFPWSNDGWPESAEFKSSAGLTVTPSVALQCSAVYACVRVLAESVASLPLALFRRAPGGRERADNHPLYQILHDSPNPEMTSFQWRETMVAHLCLRGNAYSQVRRNAQGRALELWPLNPDLIDIGRDRITGALSYTLEHPSRGPRDIAPINMLHVRGLSDNGIVGYTPIELAGNSVGLNIAAESYGARFFSNDASPGGILRHPGTLTDEAFKHLRDGWERRHGGHTNSHRPAILEEGMEWQAMSIKPEEAQFLETRKFQVNDIARIFRVPPHMIGDLERATFSNIEHQSIDFVIHTLRPWLVRIEQQLNRSLLSPSEQSEYYFEFSVDGLLRGDAVSRHNAYASAIQFGWMSRNEVRKRENLPHVDGLDDYLEPENMRPAGTYERDEAGSEERTAVGRWVLPQDLEARSVDDRRRLRASSRRAFEEVGRRIVRRERADVMRAANKYLAKGEQDAFLDWLSDFYQRHREWIQGVAAATFATYGEQVHVFASKDVAREPEWTDELEDFVRSYLEAFAARHSQSSEGQLRQQVTEAEDDGRKALEQRFDEWEERRPAKIADRETNQLSNAVSKVVYAAAGVVALKWRATGKSCPYCNALDGRSVGMDAAFVGAGEFKPDGASEPMLVRRDAGHPPLHEGCDCYIVPEL